MLDPVEMTPQQFELEVKKILDSAGIPLPDFSTQNREIVRGSDGSYEIDVTARFEALGVSFLVLVECKHHKNPIKREVVQALYDKLRSVGAQKGILFATTSFQEGAIEYAQPHGIALVQVTDGKCVYITKMLGKPPRPPRWEPSFASWLVYRDEHGSATYHLLTVEPDALREALM